MPQYLIITILLLVSSVYSTKTSVEKVNIEWSKICLNTSSQACKDLEFESKTSVNLYFNTLRADDVKEFYYTEYVEQNLMWWLRRFYDIIVLGLHDESEQLASLLFHNETLMSINSKLYNVSTEFMIALYHKIGKPNFVDQVKLGYYTSRLEAYGGEVDKHDTSSSIIKNYTMSWTTIANEKYDDNYYIEFKSIQEFTLLFNLTHMSFDSIDVNSYITYSMKLPDDRLLQRLYCNTKLNEKEEESEKIVDWLGFGILYIVLLVVITCLFVFIF